MKNFSVHSATCSRLTNINLCVFCFYSLPEGPTLQKEHFVLGSMSRDSVQYLDMSSFSFIKKKKLEGTLVPFASFRQVENREEQMEEDHNPDGATVGESNPRARGGGI